MSYTRVVPTLLARGVLQPEPYRFRLSRRRHDGDGMPDAVGVRPLRSALMAFAPGLAAPGAAAIEAAAECRVRWAPGLRIPYMGEKMLGRGFEPLCLAALAPQASVSASSTTPAHRVHSPWSVVHRVQRTTKDYDRRATARAFPLFLLGPLRDRGRTGRGVPVIAPSDADPTSWTYLAMTPWV